MIEVKCDWCGKTFNRPSWRIKKQQKHYFCNYKCRGNYLNKKIEVKCNICGKMFKRKPSKIINRKHHFCSKKCNMVWLKKNNYKGGKKESKCSYCSKKIVQYPYQIKRAKLHFCNGQCQGKFFVTLYKGLYKGENSPSWQGGKSFEPYGLDFNKKLKGQIRKRDNYTCQECYQTEKDLGYILRIHHIDYNKKNNNPTNLIGLCKSCHAQTNFNRDDWTKYFMNCGDKHEY